MSPRSRQAMAGPPKSPSYTEVDHQESPLQARAPTAPGLEISCQMISEDFVEVSTSDLLSSGAVHLNLQQIRRRRLSSLSTELADVRHLQLAQARLVQLHDWHTSTIFPILVTRETSQNAAPMSQTTSVSCSPTSRHAHFNDGIN